jgi:hypothetical protein
MGSADTVVAKDMGSNGEQLCEWSITFGAECLLGEGDAVTEKILFEDVTTSLAQLSRKRRATAGTGCDSLLGCKVEAPLPLSSLVLARAVVGFWLEKAVGICFSGNEESFPKRLADTRL